MIHTIQSLGQITENSSTFNFWLIDLNTLSVSLRAASSVDIPFLKLLFCDQYVVCWYVDVGLI